MRALILAAALLTTGAQAAERTYAVGSFSRVRVEGPFDVRVTTGSPRARAEGDARALERVQVSVDGDLLVVRMGLDGWGETPKRAMAAPVVTLSTPALRGAAVNGGGKLSVATLTGSRVDLSVNGAGAISVAAADADQLSATVIGAGALTLAGRAGRARLAANGPGAIDAGALVAGDVTVQLDGVGEIKADATRTAQVVDTGLGRVTVSGAAKCTIRAPAGGPVTCGAAP